MHDKGELGAVTLRFGSVRARVTSSRPMHGSYGYLVRGYGYKTGYSTLHTVWFGRVFFYFYLKIQTSMHLI